MVGNILGGCLFESVLTIWCSSLLEDARSLVKAVCKVHLKNEIIGRLHVGDRLSRSNESVGYGKHCASVWVHEEVR